MQTGCRLAFQAEALNPIACTPGNRNLLPSCALKAPTQVWGFNVTPVACWTRSLAGRPRCSYRTMSANILQTCLRMLKACVLRSLACFVPSCVLTGNPGAKRSTERCDNLPTPVAGGTSEAFPYGLRCMLFPALTASAPTARMTTLTALLAPTACTAFTLPILSSWLPSPPSHIRPSAHMRAGGATPSPTRPRVRVVTRTRMAGTETEFHAR